MKRLALVLLCLAVGATLFAGCKGKKSTDQQDTQKGPAAVCGDVGHPTKGGAGK
jgi:hypothetical protein